ncbi:hypothetical protein D0S48_18265 [Psychrobacillus sp. AK 1817]|uniref:DUF6414 family protein n=1 Tax=Psychrobacillus sp. AK 1817 TaxID=2303505 RepID=UPI001244DE82|nr:DUF6414 family protein [Psychrobacillus sp. AK 1817]QEY22444.1 hypothetical protein D0S48_18265 [Psychrobacillus sp. AK 1817]
MQKVIYFDEGSATDILQIEYGGELISVDEEKGTVHFGGKAEVSAEVGAGTNFFTAIKAAFSVKVSADAASASDSLVTKTISNTILADFYGLSSKLKEEEKLHIFKGFSIRPIKNSFAFIKMYTPYMKIIKEDSPLMSEMQDFDIHKLDEILENAKGYYELLAYKDDTQVILRFNINTFKNAYSLMDLPKMKLQYYAVEVGEAKETDLIIENEMDGNGETTRLSASEVLGDDVGTNAVSDYLKVYDVILAGVEAKSN